jgi:hypothetical protein
MMPNPVRREPGSTPRMRTLAAGIVADTDATTRAAAPAEAAA